MLLDTLDFSTIVSKSFSSIPYAPRPVNTEDAAGFVDPLHGILGGNGAVEQDELRGVFKASQRKILRLPDCLSAARYWALMTGGSNAAQMAPCGAPYIPTQDTSEAMDRAQFGIG